MPEKAGLYVRVSTKGQSVDLQLAELRQVVVARGWTPLEYADHGESGKKESRPALNRMMADAQAGKLQVVAVWKLDRLGRSTRHVLQILDSLRTMGVSFVSLRDAGLDTTTPMGKAMTRIIAAFAELERDIIRERVKAGVAEAKAKGKHCGRPKLTPTEDQAAAARRLQAEGWGSRRISEALGVKRTTLRRWLAGGQKSTPPEAA